MVGGHDVLSWEPRLLNTTRAIWSIFFYPSPPRRSFINMTSTVKRSDITASMSAGEGPGEGTPLVRERFEEEGEGCCSSCAIL